MNTPKLLVYLVIWLLLASALHHLVPDLRRILDFRTGMFVFALPWLICFAGHGPSDVLWAVVDPLSKDAAELPVDRRKLSAGILRKIGSLSLSAGVLTVFASLLNITNAVARSEGQASHMDFVSGAPAAMLGPLLGYVLCSFVYEPLALSLESVDSGLGSELALK